MRELLVVGVLAALGLLAGTASADTLRVGRYRFELPEGMRATVATFDDGRTGGDSGLSIKGQTLRLLAADGEPVALLVVRTVSGSGLFQWSSSCKGVQQDSTTFVHTPFDDNDTECLIVEGPVDLDATLRAMQSHSDSLGRLSGLELGGSGYYYRAILGVESGEMLDVTALVARPFDGLAVQQKHPSNPTEIPDRFIAWGLTLAEQVKAGVRSLSGRVRVPDIQRRADGPARIATSSHSLLPAPP